MVGPTRIPGIEYAAPPRAAALARTLAWPPRIIVVHDTGNPNSDRFAEARYAATRVDSSDHWTSAHAYIDPVGVLGSLPLSLQAWAAYGYANANGIHLEMCIKGGLQVGTVARTAALVRQLCQLTGIPMVKLSPAEVAAGRRGICGHYDITVGLKVGDHIDPGKSFNWAGFMQQVNVGGVAALEGEDMTPEQDQRLTNIEQWLVHYLGGEVTGTWPHSTGVVPQMVPNALLHAIAAKVDLDPAELDAVEARAKTGAAAALVEARAGLVAAITAALPPTGSGPGGGFTSEDLADAAEAGVRRALGGLDGAVPPPSQ